MKLLNNSLLLVLPMLIARVWASNYTDSREIDLDTDIVDMQYTFQQKYLIVAYKSNISVFNGITAVFVSDVNLDKNQSVKSMSVSQDDSSLLAVGFIDGVSKTFTLENDTYTEDQTFTPDEQSQVVSLCFTVDQAYLVIGLHSMIYIGNVSTGQMMTSASFEEQPIFTVACHPNDSQIFSVGGGENQTGKLIQYNISQQTITIDGMFSLENNVTTLYAVYIQNGDFILRTTTYGTILTYDTTSFQQVNRLETQNQEQLYKVQISHNAKILATVNQTHVLVYQKSNDSTIYQLSPDQVFATDLALFALTPTGGNVFYKKEGVDKGEVLGYCSEGQFYNDTQGDCVACAAQCSLCLNSSSDCFECYQAFYLENMTCQSCSIGCLECESKNNCTNCNESDNFSPDPVDGQCVCMQRFFPKQETCSPCIDGCLKCQDASTCINCDAQHKKQDDKCVCDDRTYDDHGQCKDCLLGCFTCKNATDCDKCDLINHFIPVNNTCECNQTQHFVLNETECVCQDGYYPSNASEEICQACDLGCLRCVSDVECEQCSDNLTLDEGICKCPSGEYIDPADISCANCSDVLDYCEQCDNAQNCTKCTSNLHRAPKDGKCLCVDGYYESGTLCLSCDMPGCLSCTDNSTCSRCDNNEGWQLNSSTSQCQCQGHFTRINDTCLQCGVGCRICTVDLQCDKCYDHFIPQPDNDSCKCQPAYYLKDNITCGKCMPGCKDCDEADSCNQCDGSQHFQMDQNKCVCMSGYVERGSVCKTCGQVFQACSLCKTNECTKCKEGEFLLKDGQCVCTDGKYFKDNGCASCPQTCKTCESSSKCMTCKDGSSLEGDMCEKNGLPAYVIVLIVLGVVAVAGAVFVLIKFVKKKKAPLMDDYNDLESS